MSEPRPPRRDPRSTWDRLRDRKMVQWGIAYLAGAWVLLQVLDVIGGQFGWPSVVGRSITAILGIGFPGALVLAWYHGDRGQQRVSGIEVLMLAGILVMAGAAVAFVARPRGSSTAQTSETPADSAASRKAIAVLPLENLSSDPENAYLAAGLHDEILTQLARVGDLRVISRTSVLTYQPGQRNLRQIGRELGVGSVIEGSVQRAGDRVRVAVQLSDARTDEHVWADSFDRQVTDVFALQSDIAQRIVAALQANLTDDERARLAAAPTTNPLAYDAYLRARALHVRRETPDALNQAEPLYRRAIELDPDFAIAHANLSSLLSFRRSGEASLPARFSIEALATAERALALDSHLPEAHLALGLHSYYSERDYDRALDELRIALRGLPNDPELHNFIASVLRRQGRWEEAAEGYRRAAELDPSHWDYSNNLSQALEALGRYEEAVAPLERAIALGSQRPVLKIRRARFFLNWHGTTDTAAAMLARAEVRTRRDSVGLLLLLRRNEDALRLQQRADHDTDATGDAALLVGHRGIAITLERLGRPQQARIHWDSARIRAEGALRPLTGQDRDQATPDNPYMLADLGLALAGLGRNPEAIEAARRATELLPVSLDGRDAPSLLKNLAAVYAGTGEADSAVAVVERLLTIPGGLTRNELRFDPRWDALRGHPRFDALTRN